MRIMNDCKMYSDKITNILSSCKIKSHHLTSSYKIFCFQLYEEKPAIETCNLYTCI